MESGRLINADFTKLFAKPLMIHFNGIEFTVDRDSNTKVSIEYTAKRFRYYFYINSLSARILIVVINVYDKLEAYVNFGSHMIKSGDKTREFIAQNMERLSIVPVSDDSLILFQYTLNDLYQIASTETHRVLILCED